MSRSTAAFIIAFLFHILLLLIVFILAFKMPPMSEKQPQENRIKVSLSELPKTVNKQEVGVKKVQPPVTPTVPPMPKGSQLQKLTKQPLQRYIASTKHVSPHQQTLNKPESKPTLEQEQPKVEPLPSQKPFINVNKAPEKKADSSEHSKLYSFLSKEDKSSQNQTDSKSEQQGSQIGQDIKELYGSDFGKLSAGEQKYIIDNTEAMRRITQQVLNRVGRVNIPNDLRVNSVNVIEFYLHPNGDMTDFKFLQKSQYYILDDTTKETIEYAYSKYPRPEQTTLIRYKVYYNLGRY